MRKIIFHYSVGFAGMDGNDARAYPDDVTEDALNRDAWEGALFHAESYGYYPEEDTPFDHDDEDEDSDCYTHGIEGSWEDYDPEKHDELVPGGGEWEFKL